MTVSELERTARRGVEMQVPQATDMLDLIHDWKLMRETLRELASGLHRDHDARADSVLAALRLKP